MKIKTLIILLPVLGASLVPVSVTGATAYATVSVNIVPPPVTVFMPESIMMGQDSQSISSEHRDVISLSTLNNNAKFNIKNGASFVYSMTVSSKVGIANKAGKKRFINNFHLPLSDDYVTADVEHDLHLMGALDKDNEPGSGPYTGQIYLTANFN